MQIFNQKKIFSEILAFSLIFAAYSETTNTTSAMSQISMPEMPQMTMPELSIEMSEISSPKINGSYYQPTVPGFKTSIKNSSTSDSASKTNSQVLQEASSSEDSILSALLGGSANLTASDISSLYDSGMFSNLSSLSALTGSGNNSSTSTNAMLQQILTSLEELKAEQKKTSVKEQENLANLKQDSSTFKTREPSILRFKINGYNVADSFSTIFFSESDPDGSFLLSADRKYYVNQKPRTETLYILFKSQKNSGSNVTYLVQPRIVQDSKNENSFVYKFCHLKSLVAEKTGNLVVVHNEDSSLSVDLLLDIDK